jgi:phosphatidylinositol alpha-mannosyltransferase
VAASALPSRAEPRIVPNGIDLDAYANSRTRVPGRVAFLGRDDHRKGLDVLTAAWPTVVGDHAGATLRVIGSDGPSKGSVEYLGRVSEEVKRAELGAAEILVTPNRGGESFGIVVLEGLASGCVVVASDLEAFRSVAGSAAVYSPVGDARALAARVSELLADPAARSRRVEAGIARSRGFGRAAVLGGYLAAYEAALATA